MEVLYHTCVEIVKSVVQVQHCSSVTLSCPVIAVRCNILSQSLEVHDCEAASAQKGERRVSAKGESASCISLCGSGAAGCRLLLLFPDASYFSSASCIYTIPITVSELRVSVTTSARAFLA